MAEKLDCSVGGALRLKGDGGVKKKKKKKKAKEVIETLEKVEEKAAAAESEGSRKRTPAELAYKKIQDKRLAERILNKASKTHKQRVEEFNSHLDKLSEHYDIPKVSWTK